jgi:hypothetical protein
MPGGEGGAQRAGFVVLGFCLIGIALFAVVDRDRSNKLAPAAAATNDTLPSVEPCGGSETVAATVKSSSVGGLSGASNNYDVSDVRIAASDPTWGRFSTVPKAGQESSFQNGYGVVHCTSSDWSVTDFGTSQVGCSGTSAPPAAVRSELQLSCQS